MAEPTTKDNSTRNGTPLLQVPEGMQDQPSLLHLLQRGYVYNQAGFTPSTLQNATGNAPGLSDDAVTYSRASPRDQDRRRSPKTAKQTVDQALRIIESVLDDDDF